MKLLALITFGAAFLLACAEGVVDPLPLEEVEPQKQSPSPPSSTPESDSQSDCTVYCYKINNCYVTKVYCQDFLKRMDVSCDRGRELFPWEYIPDPPYNSRNNE